MIYEVIFGHSFYSSDSFREGWQYQDILERLLQLDSFDISDAVEAMIYFLERGRSDQRRLFGGLGPVEAIEGLTPRSNLGRVAMVDAEAVSIAILHTSEVCPGRQLCRLQSSLEA